MYANYDVDTTLSQIIDHYLAAQTNRRLSNGTIEQYSMVLGRFTEFFGEKDPIPESIQPHHIDHFLSRFRSLSDKTLLNHYIALSALWTWMLKREYVSRHIVREVDPPMPGEKDVTPFTEKEIQQMMTATWKMPWAGPMLRALVLTLAGTGLRNSEVCALRIRDREVDQLHVRNGKGKKSRRVYLPRTAQDAIAVYHSLRENLEPDDFMFLNAHLQPLNRHRVYKLVQTLGEAAKVESPTVHKFRHYFAVGFLKKNGDIRFLQSLLGHSDIRTTARYLNVTNEDVMDAARKFNPLDGTG